MAQVSDNFQQGSNSMHKAKLWKLKFHMTHGLQKPGDECVGSRT